MYFRTRLFIEEIEVTEEDSGTHLDFEEEREKLKKYFGTLDIVG